MNFVLGKSDQNVRDIPARITQFINANALSKATIIAQVRMAGILT
jgi:hypothetical protein